ncbi:MAG: hypothetical protein M3271_04300, partial [Actinomycetota bacterium]|nr:hypothetical protein [Actinomycetota bacterium]
AEGGGLRAARVVVGDGGGAPPGGRDAVSAFTAGGTENHMVWDRRAAPFMEVWYATVTHRRLRSGLWLRYTISAPRQGDPSCALWAFYFDPDNKRSFAGRNDHPIDVLGHVPGRDDGALVRICDAWLSETHLDGRVALAGRTLAWSLDVEPADRCYQHLPRWLRARAAQRFSTLCSPNLSVPVSGTVEVDGEPIHFDREPGCQSHRWGRRHSHSWAWAHCASWGGDEPAVFEGLAAKAAAALPPLTFLYLRNRGEDLVFGTLRARSRFALPGWDFTARNGRWKIAGAARFAVDATVQVRYADPDGGERHCANSEIADLSIELYERAGRTWRPAASLVSKGAAHFELGRPTAFGAIPVAF